jgi:hypothetical protein
MEKPTIQLTLISRNDTTYKKISSICRICEY